MYFLCCRLLVSRSPRDKCVAIMVDTATQFIRKAQHLVLSPLPLTRRPSIATAFSKAGQICSGVASPPRALSSERALATQLQASPNRPQKHLLGVPK